jgi:anti-sigma-K factor RskA
VSAPDHTRWSEDVAAYLLGALPEEERVGFERHLAGCPECRREVEDLAVAVDALPTAAPPVTPPPELKQRIMSVVDSEASLLAAAGSEADRAQRAPAPRERRGLGRLLGRNWTLRPAFALAASVVLLALGAAGGILVGGGGGSETVVAQVTGPAARASARLEISGDRSRLVMSDFPQPPAGRVYQVWTKRPGQNPVPTDVLWTPLADGSATVSVPGSLKGVQNVLVSAEPQGGSAAPTSMPVLNATLS